MKSKHHEWSKIVFFATIFPNEFSLQIKYKMLLSKNKAIYISQVQQIYFAAVGCPIILIVSQQTNQNLSQMSLIIFLRYWRNNCLQ